MYVGGDLNSGLHACAASSLLSHLLCPKIKLWLKQQCSGIARGQGAQGKGKHFPIGNDFGSVLREHPGYPKNRVAT